MIATLVAAVALQVQPVADVATAVRDLPAWCAQAGSGSATLETPNGTLVFMRRGGLQCGLHIQPWRGDDGAFAATVVSQLAPEAAGWYPVRHRELVVNESGPMRWTEYEHELAGFIRLIEPAEGATGTLTLDLLAGD